MLELCLRVTAEGLIAAEAKCRQGMVAIVAAKGKHPDPAAKGKHPDPAAKGKRPDANSPSTA